ncbi:MAG: hypothetical protein ACRD0U_14925 [Acidimicrobiales bacterium]
MKFHRRVLAVAVLVFALMSAPAQAASSPNAAGCPPGTNLIINFPGWFALCL